MIQSVGLIVAIYCFVRLVAMADKKGEYSGSIFIRFVSAIGAILVFCLGLIILTSGGK